MDERWQQPAPFDESHAGRFGRAMERVAMVRSQIARRGVHDAAVLTAMAAVPRHLFVPAASREEAYEDHPLPIGPQQTISQPYIVALMTALAHVHRDSRVLEVGTGTGYQAAVLDELGATVHSVELDPGLAVRAQTTLAELGFRHVHVHAGDGTEGWPAGAPYDAILVTAAAPELSPAWLDQLAPGGRLVAPIGSRDQVLEVVTRGGQIAKPDFRVEEIAPVSFVPMGHG